MQRAERAQRPYAPHASLLLASVPARLVLAGLFSLVLWIAVWWALS